MTDTIKIIKDNVNKYGKLLYLSYFGSKLYGTDNPNSDTDLKGVYVPDEKIMLLGKHFHNRNIDSIIINSIEGFDIEIYSIQYFLKLCSKGDVGALDLLFSYTKEDAVLYLDEDNIYKDLIINNSDKLFNRFNISAFIGYSHSQALKYGIKSEKLQCIKELLKFLSINFNNTGNFLTVLSIKDYIEDFIEKNDFKTHCYFYTDTENKYTGSGEDIEYLYVCGKKHQTTIKVIELIERLDLQEKSYGKRTTKNIETNNIDWKGLSHALRVIYECQELLTKGHINFPLVNSYELIRIKEGKIDIETVTKRLNTELNNTYKLEEILLNDENKEKYNVDKELIMNIIYEVYKDDYHVGNV